MSTGTADTPLLRTPLHAQHVALGARMVPFAGYDMPVQYPLGVLKEHLHTRAAAGLFDVSHMGQAILIAEDGRHETVACALEALVPADILDLEIGRQRYSQLLGADGGILDDIMVTRPADPRHSGGLMLVVNAARKDADFAHIAARLPKGLRLEPRPGNALIAIQGPLAADALAAVLPGTGELAFMSAAIFTRGGVAYHVSRSGYTGEDGFEIILPNDPAAELWRTLLADARVQPIGLGARDSLRLEAGLCLYGADIDTTTSPVEAGLVWSIQKVRRRGGARAGGFPGADVILGEIERGPARRRVGLSPEGRAPVRAGTQLFATSEGGDAIGTVTSGGFGPSVGAPISMAYVPAALAKPGTRLFAEVRGKRLAVDVVPLPFFAHRYKRGPAAV